MDEDNEDDFGFVWAGGFAAGDGVVFRGRIRGWVISALRFFVPRGHVPIRYPGFGVELTRIVPADTLERL